MYVKKKNDEGGVLFFCIVFVSKIERMKRSICLLGILIIGALSCFSQTTVRVVYTDAMYEDFTVADAGKLYFSGDNMLVDKGDLNPTTIALDNVRKVLFIAVESTGVDAISAVGSVYVYPNPATNFITVNGIAQAEYPVEIYSSFGLLLVSTTTSANAKIDVSSFAAGLYFVKVGNEIVKFNKL